MRFQGWAIDQTCQAMRDMTDPDVQRGNLFYPRTEGMRKRGNCYGAAALTTNQPCLPSGPFRRLAFKADACLAVRSDRLALENAN